MRCLPLLILTILLIACASFCGAAQKMRPYSGIGVLQLSSVAAAESTPLYDDPGIARCCKLSLPSIRELNSWLFGTTQGPFLLVTAHKGDWLEVEYDDAGRTGWIMPERHWNYLPWHQFLKSKLALFLRNSPKKQMQLLPRPGVTEGTPLLNLHPMKIILSQGDWAYVLLDQNNAGWIRWRDNDGRLLIGFDTMKQK